MRRFLKSKIHRATVNRADLHYEGSISIPKELLIAADIREYEEVHIWNVTNGSRFQTYAILSEESSAIQINGAAAHLTSPGDLVIIASFAYLNEGDITNHQPIKVFVDQNNSITNIE